MNPTFRYTPQDSKTYIEQFEDFLTDHLDNKKPQKEAGNASVVLNIPSARVIRSHVSPTPLTQNNFVAFAFDPYAEQLLVRDANAMLRLLLIGHAKYEKIKGNGLGNINGRLQIKFDAPDEPDEADKAETKKMPQNRLQALLEVAEKYDAEIDTEHLSQIFQRYAVGTDSGVSSIVFETYNHLPANPPDAMWTLHDQRLERCTVSIFDQSGYDSADSLARLSFTYIPFRKTRAYMGVFNDDNVPERIGFYPIVANLRGFKTVASARTAMLAARRNRDANPTSESAQAKYGKAFAQLQQSLQRTEIANDYYTNLRNLIKEMISLLLKSDLRDYTLDRSTAQARTHGAATVRVVASFADTALC